MKFANIAGRMALISDQGALDIHEGSGGRLPSDPNAALAQWSSVLDWANSADMSAAMPFDQLSLGAPSPRPSQVFAIGLNYAPHVAEAGFTAPPLPFVFTKTQQAIVGPFEDLPLPSEHVDWEVEVVAVIGRRADRVSADVAWDHVAGLTVGQDYSDREVQSRLGPNSQPALGKSRPGFGPTGPFLVTADELRDRDDLEVTCRVNDVVMQSARSSELIFPIAYLIEYLSAVTPLEPGDLIFTGTPAGVGAGRTPAIYLQPGDVIETVVEDLGTMRQVAVRAVNHP